MTVFKTFIILFEKSTFNCFIGLNYKMIKLILIVVLFISCNDNEQQKLLTVDSNAKVADSVNDMQIFLLPSPLQVGSTLKLSRLFFNDKLIIKPKEDFGILTSAQNALLLGAITIDAGYSAIFNQNQTTLHYAKSISKLQSNLKINSVKNQYIFDRLQRNHAKSDSLTHLIMECYSESHHYFRDNNKEELGLQIIAGSLIESVYLCVNQQDVLEHKELKNLISQQKNYVNNLYTLLTLFSQNKDSEYILNSLSRLNSVFNKIEVFYDNDKLISRISVANIDEIKIVVNEERIKLFNI